MEDNLFLKEKFMGEGSVFTDNGAISYASTGSELTNQFGKCGIYLNRDYETIWADQSRLWCENELNGIRFPFYLRAITRNIHRINEDFPIKGQGLRNESFKRLLWVLAYKPDNFYDNIKWLPYVGAWKDIFELMAMTYYDKENMPVRVVMDYNKMFSILGYGLCFSDSEELIKKYMPGIRSNNKCKTNRAKALNKIAKDFCAWLNISPKTYRELKSSGTAHDFQKIICSGQYEKINWKTIPGIALSKLTAGKFLSNHNLEKTYIDWLYDQPTVKFNGYPFELSFRYQKNKSLANAVTIDKQFEQLIKTAKEDNRALKGNILCALDTSGSMQRPIKNGVSALDVCLSLGIYFSELNEGAFHNVIAMFDVISRLKKISGTFSQKLNDITSSTIAWGNTNFMSLIDLIIETRVKIPDIPISEYPETLLIVSDMQFDDCGDKSNYQTAIEKLLEVFPKEYVNNFKIVWWYCSGMETTDFPSTMEDAGTYMISGFDGAVISFLLGGEGLKDKFGNVIEKPTMEDMALSALNQPFLLNIR